MVAVLADLFHGVVVSDCAILQVVYRELNRCGLARLIVRRQLVRVGEVQLSQPFRLWQEFPAVQLSVDRRVETKAQCNNNNNPYA